LHDSFFLFSPFHRVYHVFMMLAIRNWDRWGKHNPLFAVISDPKFLADNVDDAALAEFFQTGEQHVKHVYATVRVKLQPDFQPTHVLDFGCGVGRLVIPFAHRADHVVGVDVSPAMLANAENNCRTHNVFNKVRLIDVTEMISSLPAAGSFNLVHSHIVFQHIRAHEGERLLQTLINLISPGGIGVIHLVFADVRSLPRRLVLQTRMRSTLLHKLFNALQGHPLSWPLMPMSNYRLDHVYKMLMERGCSSVHSEFTNHGGFLGTVLYFKVP
jgi:SAM-dependent methyltransferase